MKVFLHIPNPSGGQVSISAGSDREMYENIKKLRKELKVMQEKFKKSANEPFCNGLSTDFGDLDRSVEDIYEDFIKKYGSMDGFITMEGECRCKKQQ